MRRRRRLGEQIRNLRSAAGMTQGDLGNALANTSAGDLPIPQTTISRWETGSVELEMEQVYAIEAVLKVPHGHLSAAAGYATAELKPGSVEEAIMLDHRLHPSVRDEVVRLYKSFLSTSKTLLDSEDRFRRLGGKTPPTNNARGRKTTISRAR